MEEMPVLDSFRIATNTGESRCSVNADGWGFVNLQKRQA